MMKHMRMVSLLMVLALSLGMAAAALGEAPAPEYIYPDPIPVKDLLAAEKGGELDKRISDDLAARAAAYGVTTKAEWDEKGESFHYDGVPSEGDVSWHDALPKLLGALKSEYGLTDENLNNFAVQFTFNVGNWDARNWQFDLDPVDGDYEAHGLWGGTVSAADGEVTSTYSADDSVG